MSRWLYVGLAALVCAVWLGTLGGRPLFNPDEGRYAEIPREMLSGGDWVIPHLNGLDYIEKPPLQYWATALNYRLFGVNEFSARLYTALSALAAVALVGFLATQLWGRDAGWRAVENAVDRGHRELYRVSSSPRKAAPGEAQNSLESEPDL